MQLQSYFPLVMQSQNPNQKKTASTTIKSSHSKTLRLLNSSKTTKSQKNWFTYPLRKLIIWAPTSEMWESGQLCLVYFVTASTMRIHPFGMSTSTSNWVTKLDAETRPASLDFRRAPKKRTRPDHLDSWILVNFDWSPSRRLPRGESMHLGQKYQHQTESRN